MKMNNQGKIAVALLTVGLGFVSALLPYEGFRSKPYQDSGGVPTIGIGTTQYEDGTRVSMQDVPITQERAVELVKAHVAKDEMAFRQSLEGAYLNQQEYDLYLDFVYQYGQTTWRKSSMRRALLRGDNVAACGDLLRYRFVASRDCKIRSNNCYGVWTRQLRRHQRCVDAQNLPETTPEILAASAASVASEALP